MVREPGLLCPAAARDLADELTTWAERSDDLLDAAFRKIEGTVGTALPSDFELPDLTEALDSIVFVQGKWDELRPFLDDLCGELIAASDLHDACHVPDLGGPPEWTNDTLTASARAVGQRLIAWADEREGNPALNDHFGGTTDPATHLIARNELVSAASEISELMDADVKLRADRAAADKEGR